MKTELTLMKITPKMVKEFCTWEFTQGYSGRFTFYDIEQYMPEMLNEDTKEFIALYNKNTDEFIGWCRARKFKTEETYVIYLGCVINPQKQKKGYGKQLLKESFAYFKKIYGEYPFVADVEENNIPSQNLVKALGFYYLYTKECDDCGIKKLVYRYIKI